MREVRRIDQPLHVVVQLLRHALSPAVPARPVDSSPTATRPSCSSNNPRRGTRRHCRSPRAPPLARRPRSRAPSRCRKAGSETFSRCGCSARLGTTAFTRTPNAAASSAAQRVSASTPAFEAAYAALPALGAPGDDARHVDDRAASARDHAGQRGAQAAERAREIRVEDPVPLLVARLDDVAGRAEARVVDEHVEAAHPLARPRAISASTCSFERTSQTCALDAAGRAPPRARRRRPRACARGDRRA